MTTIEEIKKLFTVGAEFEEYYGNGERQHQQMIDGSKIPVVGTVKKVSEKLCWINHPR